MRLTLELGHQENTDFQLKASAGTRVPAKKNLPFTSEFMVGLAVINSPELGATKVEFLIQRYCP